MVKTGLCRWVYTALNASQRSPGRQGAGKVSFTGGRLRRWLSNESAGFFSQSAKSSNVEDLDLSLLILFTTPAHRCRLLRPFPAQLPRHAAGANLASSGTVLCKESRWPGGNFAPGPSWPSMREFSDVKRKSNDACAPLYACSVCLTHGNLSI
jgi:hypothetical protein